jgi:hypothetical protein
MKSNDKFTHVSFDKKENNDFLTIGLYFASFLFMFVRIYRKYNTFFVYFIIMLISNILYLWADCNQIKEI